MSTLSNYRNDPFRLTIIRKKKRNTNNILDTPTKSYLKGSLKGLSDEQDGLPHEKVVKMLHRQHSAANKN